ncbi:MAG: sugar kinase [Paracoccaceae bacterium]
MTDILFVGEAMVELRLDPDAPRAAVGFSGDTFNAAVYCARALPGRVDYVTALGRDAISERMAAFMVEQGVGTGRIARRPDRTVGLYAIDTDARGERSFTYWRAQSAARTLFADGFGALEGARLVHHSAITLAILPPEIRTAFLDHLAGLRARGTRIAFDSNWRPALWPDADVARAAIERAWRTCDIGLPSLDDEQALMGDADAPALRDRLRDWGVTHGAIKRGARGPLDLGGAPDRDWPVAQRVIDTTAAGDSFDGAYLAAVLSGDPDPMAAAHRMARHVVGHAGAIVPPPAPTA